MLIPNRHDRDPNNSIRRISEPTQRLQRAILMGDYALMASLVVAILETQGAELDDIILKLKRNREAGHSVTRLVYEARHAQFCSVLSVFVKAEVLLACHSFSNGEWTQDRIDSVAHLAERLVFQTLLCKYAPMPYRTYDGFSEMILENVELVVGLSNPDGPGW